jgi:hypothetical protein
MPGQQIQVMPMLLQQRRGWMAIRGNEHRPSPRAYFGRRSATSRSGPGPELYLLIVVADADEGSFETCWLVPSEDFAARTRPNAAGIRRFLRSHECHTHAWCVRTECA